MQDEGPKDRGPDSLLRLAPGMRSEPVHMPEPSARRPVPGLALGLALAKHGHSNDDATPRTVRGPALKPPMLALVNPASASPVHSNLNTPVMRQARSTSLAHTTHAHDHAHDPSGPPSSRGPTIRVELVSSAFALPHDATEGGADRIREHASSSLGVAPGQLTLYELRPLALGEGGALPVGCSHVGVAVQSSSASAAVGGTGSWRNVFTAGRQPRRASAMDACCCGAERHTRD